MGPLRIGTQVMMVLLDLKSEVTSRVVGAVAIVYAKRRMSVKPSSVKRSTKFWFRRLNGITTPFSPFGVQNAFCSFLDSSCDFGHNAGEVEGV